jgi:hypothetical protein
LRAIDSVVVHLLFESWICFHIGLTNEAARSFLESDGTFVPYCGLPKRALISPSTPKANRMKKRELTERGDVPGPQRVKWPRARTNIRRPWWQAEPVRTSRAPVTRYPDIIRTYPDNDSVGRVRLPQHVTSRQQDTDYETITVQLEDSAKLRGKCQCPDMSGLCPDSPMLPDGFGLSQHPHCRALHGLLVERLSLLVAGVGNDPENCAVANKRASSSGPYVCSQLPSRSGTSAISWRIG